MIEQLALFAPARLHDGVPRAYVTQGQEKPADLPRLRESAATMERRVLEWFEAQICPTLPVSRWAMTPSMCAEALGLELTTVRPRICQLAKRTEGPRLERCKWIKRRPTQSGSEGYFRFREDV